MAETSKVKIFISYSHQDIVIADLIVKTLEEVGLSPWIDRTEIQPGDSFVERINQGLAKASYAILLLSQTSTASRWVSREWMSTLADDQTVLLPIVIEDCEIPPLLRDIIYIDLRSNIDAGLSRLRFFFEKERTSIPVSPRTTRTKSHVTPLRKAPRRHLRLIALRCMTEQDFLGFLLDADLAVGMIPGNSLHERITNLLVRVATDGDLEKFADWLYIEPNCRRCVSKELQRLTQEDSWSLG